MFGGGNIEDESLLKNAIIDNNMIDSVTWHKSVGPDRIVEYMKSSAVYAANKYGYRTNSFKRGFGNGFMAYSLR